MEFAKWGLILLYILLFIIVVAAVWILIHPLVSVFVGGVVAYIAYVRGIIKPSDKKLS